MEAIREIEDYDMRPTPRQGSNVSRVSPYHQHPGTPWAIKTELRLPEKILKTGTLHPSEASWPDPNTNRASLQALRLAQNPPAPPSFLALIRGGSLLTEMKDERGPHLRCFLLSGGLGDIFWVNASRIAGRL